ncbi:MAG: rod shape-determining protein RodA [Rickettsiaceae bacterium]|nr:MAG: rod shape-determining protein RodA [Rickettsiaceae bacterium]
MYYSRNYFAKFYKLPFILLGLVVIISFFGLINLWSAAGGNLLPWAQKQMINFCLFFTLSIIIALTDIKYIFKFSYLFYFTVLILLLSVELFGINIMGGKRWLDLGITRLQPSEPAKIAMVLMLAKFFHQAKIEDITSTKKILIPIIASLLPIILIIKQPDLGTGIILLIITIIMFFNSGVQIWKFIVLGVSAMFCLPVIWYVMYEYQRKRVIIFLNPEQDPLGAGYNIIQSKIAIGSGGLFGKGLAQGTQSKLEFLPEHQTDFIFASLAEETGFIGCLFLLILYALIIIICLTIIVDCKTIFGKFVVIGMVSILASHVFINIAMVTGLLPVVGVPLPFISYGGTMTASMLIGIGLIMNVAVHKNTNLIL